MADIFCLQVQWMSNWNVDIGVIKEDVQAGRASKTAPLVQQLLKRVC